MDGAVQRSWEDPAAELDDGVKPGGQVHFELALLSKKISKDRKFRLFLFKSIQLINKLAHVFEKHRIRVIPDHHAI